MNRKIKYEIDSVLEIEDDNSIFAKGKIMIGYCGRNRNYSDISEEVYLNSNVLGVPIVANFIPEKNDFGGHDIRVVNGKEDMDIFPATIPFGFVPESAKQWFTEEMVCGKKRRCFWTECLIWKRQFGFQKIADVKVVKHSMEIDVSDYTIDNEGYCVVNKMQFEALCLLGSDVEPCFENSRLELFSKAFTKSDFDKQFKEMMSQYRTYCLDFISEVNNEVNEIKQITDEVVESTEVDVTPEFSNAESENVESEVAESETTEIETTESENIEATESENNELESTESEVTDEMSVDIAEQTEISDDNEIENQIADVSFNLDDYNKLKEEYDLLVSEIEELRRFKLEIESKERLNAENELFSKFDEKLNSIEEYKLLKENKSKYSIEEIEEKAFAIVGRYGINIFNSTKSEDTNTTVKFSLTENSKETKSIYGDIFERYSNK